MLLICIKRFLFNRHYRFSHLDIDASHAIHTCRLSLRRHTSIHTKHQIHPVQSRPRVALRWDHLLPMPMDRLPNWCRWQCVYCGSCARAQAAIERAVVKRFFPHIFSQNVRSSKNVGSIPFALRLFDWIGLHVYVFSRGAFSEKSRHPFGSLA